MIRAAAAAARRQAAAELRITADCGSANRADVVIVDCTAIEELIARGSV
jgi:hypothetical protein